jgi:hypothetical protein
MKSIKETVLVASMAIVLLVGGQAANAADGPGATCTVCNLTAALITAINNLVKSL